MTYWQPQYAKLKTSFKQGRKLLMKQGYVNTNLDCVNKIMQQKWPTESLVVDFSNEAEIQIISSNTETLY